MSGAQQQHRGAVPAAASVPVSTTSLPHHTTARMGCGPGLPRSRLPLSLWRCGCVWVDEVRHGAGGRAGAGVQAWGVNLISLWVAIVAWVQMLGVGLQVGWDSTRPIACIWARSICCSSEHSAATSSPALQANACCGAATKRNQAIKVVLSSRLQWRPTPNLLAAWSRSRTKARGCEGRRLECLLTWCPKQMKKTDGV